MTQQPEKVMVDAHSIKQRNQMMSKGEYKTRNQQDKINPQGERLGKPRWIRAKLPKAKDMGRINDIKNQLRQANLHSVCEEASCPNLGECFGHGTATFMIMGGICTRACPFCDVAHGRPNPLDPNEPQHLATTVTRMGLKYVVVTSVDRDDLTDGGAAHFAQCVQAIRQVGNVKVEILVPDFRRRMDKAVAILQNTPPDVFNHNMETVPRLYEYARPGADYQGSLDLLQAYKHACPSVPTKSGLMVGLGETYEELLTVMQDLRNHGVTMLTVGQYLQPSLHHLPVHRYWTPEEFTQIEEAAYAMGFEQAACGPMVRSSYHADLQAKNIIGDTP